MNESAKFEINTQENIEQQNNQPHIDELYNQNQIKENTQNEPTMKTSLEGIGGNREISIEAPGISLDKTNDILRQVNEYLEEERKKLN